MLRGAGGPGGCSDCLLGGVLSGGNGGAEALGIFVPLEDLRVEAFDNAGRGGADRVFAVGGDNGAEREATSRPICFQSLGRM